MNNEHEKEMHHTCSTHVKISEGRYTGVDWTIILKWILFLEKIGFM
jgi:hypothetical protein